MTTRARIERTAASRDWRPEPGRARGSPYVQNGDRQHFGHESTFGARRHGAPSDPARLGRGPCPVRDRKWLMVRQYAGARDGIRVQFLDFAGTESRPALGRSQQRLGPPSKAQKPYEPKVVGIPGFFRGRTAEASRAQRECLCVPPPTRRCQVSGAERIPRVTWTCRGAWRRMVSRSLMRAARSLEDRSCAEAARPRAAEHQTNPKLAGFLGSSRTSCRSEASPWQRSGPPDGMTPGGFPASHGDPQREPIQLGGGRGAGAGPTQIRYALCVHPAFKRRSAAFRP